MNRNFRTVSALVRGGWLIEESFAQAHEQIINAYLSGQHPQAFEKDDETEDDEDAVPSYGYAVAAPADAATAADAAGPPGGNAPQTRYALDDPNLPDDSILIVDIRGAIFKEGFCWSAGTEDYVRLINQAYATPQIIGIVCLVDSPGGQLSGTPTLFDAIRNPAKPTVSVCNEGLMASAAYWLACGSDFIYATQKTDQIGSIGVFVTLRDSREAMTKAGYKTYSVYSDRSTQKNKPVRDALDGNDKLLKAELNQAADLFREAVEEGRGDRLKNGKAGSADDVFLGGLFYAGKAIELGLIDAYGDVNTAIEKVVELHKSRTQNGPTSAVKVSEIATPETVITDSSAHINASDTHINAPVTSTETTEVHTDPAADSESDKPVSNPNPQSQNQMFGYVKLAALAAIQGLSASDVTDAQITALNTELAAAGYNVAVISQAQFEQAQTAQTDLNAANSKITELQGKVTELGDQPGHLGSKSQKEKEQAAGETDTYISETDLELNRLRGNKD